MRELIGVDIWDFHAQGKWICIPTNGVVKADGTLVMGKGLALEAARRYPQLRTIWGSAVRDFGNIPAPAWSLKILSFPTKHHWRDPADLDLIEESARDLMRFLWFNEDIEEIYLPRPGVGCGGLSWDVVKPVLDRIVDKRVIVVTK